MTPARMAMKKEITALKAVDRWQDSQCHRHHLESEGCAVAEYRDNVLQQGHYSPSRPWHIAGDVNAYIPTNVHPASSRAALRKGICHSMKSMSMGRQLQVSHTRRSGLTTVGISVLNTGKGDHAFCRN
ncbi:unnamed protein product [Effrenium voratum]|nr:unnamed protein product [Effrenium voratum]